MAHISYAMVVHDATGRIVYKTRNKTGGEVNLAIKTGTLQPFGDVCYIGDTLQPDYIVGRIALDDHVDIDYQTQRWNSETDTLRDATPAEIAEYQDVTGSFDAANTLRENTAVTALIEVLAPLHDMPVDELRDLVIGELKSYG